MARAERGWRPSAVKTGAFFLGQKRDKVAVPTLSPWVSVRPSPPHTFPPAFLWRDAKTPLQVFVLPRRTVRSLPPLFGGVLALPRFVTPLGGRRQGWAGGDLRGRKRNPQTARVLSKTLEKCRLRCSCRGRRGAAGWLLALKRAKTSFLSFSLGAF